MRQFIISAENTPHNGYIAELNLLNKKRAIYTKIRKCAKKFKSVGECKRYLADHSHEILKYDETNYMNLQGSFFIERIS